MKSRKIESLARDIGFYKFSEEDPSWYFDDLTGEEIEDVAIELPSMSYESLLKVLTDQRNKLQEYIATSEDRVASAKERIDELHKHIHTVLYAKNPKKTKPLEIKPGFYLINTDEYVAEIVEKVGREWRGYIWKKKQTDVSALGVPQPAYWSKSGKCTESGHLARDFKFNLLERSFCKTVYDAIRRNY